MICPNCGKEIGDTATICVNCGASLVPNASAVQQNYQQPTQNYQQAPQGYQQGYQQAPQGYQQGYQQAPQGYQQNYQQPYDAAADVPSTGFKVLSFFIPLAGLILYCVNKDKTPVSAKAYGKMAIIGFCVSLGLSILSSVFSTVMVALFS